VVYYSTPMAVAYGRSAKAAALNGRIITAKPLEAPAAKQSRAPRMRRKARASGLFLAPGRRYSGFDAQKSCRAHRESRHDERQ
jgi:hypothetical protein